MKSLCRVHRVPLVARAHPFTHYACPVAGCDYRKANKWGHKNKKRKPK